MMPRTWSDHIVSVLSLRWGRWGRWWGGARTPALGGGCDDLWGNLTLKRMQMREQINIQRRSLVEAIRMEHINIQRRRAGIQNNTVSKTTTQTGKQEENKSILMEAP